MIAPGRAEAVLIAVVAALFWGVAAICAALLVVLPADLLAMALVGITGAASAFAAILISGHLAVALRCRLALDGDCLAGVRVAARSGLWPRFEYVSLPLADVVAVYSAERIIPTPWSHDVVQCLWVETRGGDRLILAAGRPGGLFGGSSAERHAASIADRAGVRAAVGSGSAFRRVGRHGGAVLEPIKTANIAP